MSPRVLLIDNFDSFTFNLVDDLRRRGAEVEVWRNTITAGRALSILEAMAPPRLLLISPGPGAPSGAGCSLELISRASALAPVFGVCLGHQCIVEAFGGLVGPAGEVVHGKTGAIAHDGRGVFAGLPTPLNVARYHSLAALEVPEALEVSATLGERVMAVRHRSLPIVGVQFHPESLLTTEGGQMFRNVFQWVAARRDQA